DRDRERALAPRRGDDRGYVWRRARLRDPDHRATGVARRGAVARDERRRGRGRDDARESLEQVLAIRCGVIGRATCCRGEVRRARDERTEPLRLGGTFVEEARHRRRLLRDLRPKRHRSDDARQRGGTRGAGPPAYLWRVMATSCGRHREAVRTKWGDSAQRSRRLPTVRGHASRSASRRTWASDCRQTLWSWRATRRATSTPTSYHSSSSDHTACSLSSHGTKRARSSVTRIIGTGARGLAFRIRCPTHRRTARARTRRA